MMLTKSILDISAIHPTASARPPVVAPVRTYRQVAEALAERGGPTLSPNRVERICKIAEVRFVRAMLADPVVGRYLFPGEPLQREASGEHRLTGILNGDRNGRAYGGSHGHRPDGEAGEPYGTGPRRVDWRE